ncbi:MAG: hypothetical protein J7K40_13795 [candidate division Zixibacteria bacterium]|nr:hypothetical protein [candidate division Zixibacteria bacterium]
MQVYGKTVAVTQKIITPEDECHLGYNVAGDLVRIRRKSAGEWYERLIDDPDVADKVVAKWVEYNAWEKM